VKGFHWNTQKQNFAKERIFFAKNFDKGENKKNSIDNKHYFALGENVLILESDEACKA
jgi:hypothetical protein